MRQQYCLDFDRACEPGVSLAVTLQSGGYHFETSLLHHTSWQCQLHRASDAAVVCSKAPDTTRAKERDFSDHNASNCPHDLTRSMLRKTHLMILVQDIHGVLSSTSVELEGRRPSAVGSKCCGRHVLVRNYMFEYRCNIEPPRVA